MTVFTLTRLTELGSVSTEHCDRCHTWLSLVCATQIGVIVPSNNGSSKISRVSTASFECEKYFNGCPEDDVDNSVQRNSTDSHRECVR